LVCQVELSSTPRKAQPPPRSLESAAFAKQRNDHSAGTAKQSYFSMMKDTNSLAAPDSRIDNEEGVRYWETIAPDVNGMLGGFPHVSRADLQSSRNFLAKLGIGTKEKQRIVQSALEGGAG
jgi:hypothetical protein